MQLTLELPVVNLYAAPPILRMMTRETPAGCRRTRLMKPEVLAKTLSSAPNCLEKLLLVDCRSFMEYNVNHIQHAINITCSKLVKRRLQHNKITIKELLATACKTEPDPGSEGIVYDQGTQDISGLAADTFLSVLLAKLNENFKTVSLLAGGYTSFQSCFPYLCESQNRPPCPARAPLSQPCLPVTNTGPTRVLGFLYLGSQQDVMSEDCLKNYGINYVLNVSRSCPIPEFLPQTHFHRIPVRDNHSEKILPWFDEALEFIDKVRSANGSVIVHCLAGISRSPTVAIAFIMRYLNMNVDEAYKYVKEKRATISPNFNFLGQLLEYEKIIRTRQGRPSTLQPSGPPKEDVEPTEKKEEGACASEPCSMLTSPKEESAKVPYAKKGLEESMLPMKPHIRKLSLENLSLPLKCSYMPGKASPRLSRTLPRVTFADAPTTPTSENKSIKRSLSRDALTEVGTQTLVTEKRSTSHLTLDLKSAPSRTLQRPTGLDVKKTVLLLDSPGDSKKPRSLCNSPSGLLEQLAWGTSHLSVHSPEVRNNNPFVEACAKFQAQQTGLSSSVQRSHPENSKSKVERTKLKLEGLVSNSETICAEVQAAENLIPVASGSSVLTAPASPSTSRSQRHKHSETSVGFQFGRSRINHPDPSSSNARVPNSSVTKDQQKPSALKKPTFGPQNSPPPIHQSSASLVSGGNVSNPFFSRQSSGQSVTSDLSLSSIASPAVDSSASSWMTPHGSVSSGISPDINLSSAASSACSSANLKPDSNHKSKGSTDMETPQVLPSGWNPFSFPQAKADDSPSSRGDNVVWQKRKDSDNSIEESAGQSQRIHQSPTTAMDRVATYITKCNFGSPDVSDSDSSEPSHPHKQKCNNKKRPKLHPSVRSQSCEEIGSCSREVVTSEIVVSARREILEYGRSALDQDEEDFDTRSLSSQRSLSSSCEMIEVS